MYKCKQNLTPPVFGNIFTNRKNTKCLLRNENSIQEPLCLKYFIPWTQSLEQNSNLKKNNLSVVVTPSKCLNVNWNYSFY